MKLLPVIRRLFVFSLALASAGAGGAYWFYTRSDELLKAELLRQLSAMFPEAHVDLNRAHFDLAGQVRAYQVSLTLPDEKAPALTIAELVVALDRDQLADSQAVEIQKVRLVRPRAWITRRADQSWNWQQLRLERSGAGVLPDLDIEHGHVTVQLEHADAASPVEINCTELRLAAHPSSERAWSIHLSSRVDGTGPVQVQGECSVDGGPWRLTAKAEGLLIDQPLIAKALAVHPPWRHALDGALSQLERLAAGTEPIARANTSTPRSVSLGGRALPDLGVQLLTDLTVQMAASGDEGAPDYSLHVVIQNGRITNPLLPLPLHDVSGILSAQGRAVELTGLRGRHGEALIECSARWAASESPVLSLRGRKIVVDETLAVRLPAPLQRLVRSMSLSGVCDFDAELQRAENADWVPKVDLTLTRGSMTHEKFRYPVRDLEGTLTWRGDLALVEARGQAGTAPLAATASIRKPGPGAEMSIVLRADDVPIDATLLDASPPIVKTTALALDLRGAADFWARLDKPAGVGEKITPNILARLKECSVKYDRFPVRIDRISGIARWDGESATFEKLRGKHAGAEISAAGTYRRSPGPGKLDVTFHAVDAPFDAELLAALPERLQEAWREFNPSGRFDAEARVAWTPGGALEIRLPSVTLKNAELTLRSFPFPWYNVSGQFRYADDILTVLALSAEHDDCRLRGAGSGMFAVDRPWRFRFNEFFVDDLPTSPALRRALPPALRAVIDALNPSQTVSLHGPIAFFGPDERRSDVGITWNTEVVLSGSHLTLGVPVKNVSGKVTLHGAWDGENAVIHHGALDIDSLEVFEHQLTQVKGPFRYQNGELIAGSRQALSGPLDQVAKDIHWEDQISGRFIDGLVLLNGQVRFDEDPAYQLRLFLNGGNLERYAQTYLKGQSNIRGNMNGWMDLRGTGTDPDAIAGAGRLTIRPAELYELPVFMQVFRVLGPQIQDRTAFKEADFRFTVANSRFNFHRISLDGNAIRLFGRGYVRFDSVVNLEFYSELSRSQMRIPLVSDIVGLMSRGWVGVTVTGRIQDPQVAMRAIPELDDALRQFLGAFEPRLVVPPPRLLPPRSGQAPQSSNNKDALEKRN